MTKVSELREANLNRVRACFSDGRIYTKNELIEATGFSSGGMVSILQELKNRKEILQEEDAASTGGRPGHRYRLNPDAYHVCCLFLKAGKEDRMEAFGMDLYGKVMAQEDVPLTDERAVTAQIRKMIHADPLIREILISVPGVSEDGRIRECDIASLSGRDLGRAAEEETGIEPVIENDVNIAAIGLQRRTGRKELAYIYQPDRAYSGVGIVIEGKLYNGAQHMAGEVRYLDSEKRQQQRLQDEPQKLLAEQIEILNAVLNPGLIGWDSRCFQDEISVNFRMKKEDQPVLVHEGLDELMREGMHGIAMYRYSGKENR